MTYFSHIDLGIVDLRDDDCNSSGVIATKDDVPAEESSINLENIIFINKELLNFC